MERVVITDNKLADTETREQCGNGVKEWNGGGGFRQWGAVHHIQYTYNRAFYFLFFCSLLTRLRKENMKSKKLVQDFHYTLIKVINFK